MKDKLYLALLEWLLRKYFIKQGYPARQRVLHEIIFKIYSQVFSEDNPPTLYSHIKKNMSRAFKSKR